MKNDQPHLRVRLKLDLLEKVRSAAEKGHRSQTAEVAMRLEESFRREELRDMIKEAVREALS